MAVTIYSAAYPIVHTFTDTGDIDYSISVDGEVIYEGSLLALNDSDALSIDIAPIVRPYLSVDYSDVMKGESTSYELTNAVRTFTISDGNTDTDYVVAAIYADEYDTTFGTTGAIHQPLHTNVDTRQRVFNCVLSTGEATTYCGATFVTYNDDGSMQNATTRNVPIFTLGLHCAQFSVDLSANGMNYIKTIGDIDYKVVESDYTHALYYVNLYGAIDTLLIRGRVEKVIEAEHTDIERFTTSIARTAFPTARLETKYTKKYKLNTGLIRNNYADRIKHVLTTRQAFLHDLEADTITAVNITTDNTSVKCSRYDRNTSYEIECTEARTFTI